MSTSPTKQGDDAIVKLRETLASASRTAGALTRRCDQWMSQARIERDAREKALSILLESPPRRRGSPYRTPPASPTKREDTTDEIRTLSAECARLKSLILRRTKEKKTTTSSRSKRKIRELERECERLKRALKKAMRNAEKPDERLKHALNDRDAMEMQMKIQNDDVNLAISEWKERDAKLKRAHALEQKRLKEEMHILKEKYELVCKEFENSKREFEMRIQDMTSSIEKIRVREENLLRENENLREKVEEARRQASQNLRENVEKAQTEASQNLAQENLSLRNQIRSFQEATESTFFLSLSLNSHSTKLTQQQQQQQNSYSKEQHWNNNYTRFKQIDQNLKSLTQIASQNSNKRIQNVSLSWNNQTDRETKNTKNTEEKLYMLIYSFVTPKRNTRNRFKK